MKKNLILAISLLISATQTHRTYGSYYVETESIQPLESALTLTRSMISVESSWDSLAVSHKGAIGLMQITQPALDDYNQKHKSNLPLSMMTNIEMNVRVGMWYFWERLIPLYDGDVVKALHSYNMGMGNLRKGKSNAVYVQRIMARP